MTVHECCRLFGTREPLYGTCGAQDFLMYIAWPRSSWHPESVVMSKGLPVELKGFLGAQAEQGRKISVRLFDEVEEGRDVLPENVLVKIFPNHVYKNIPLSDAVSTLESFFAGHTDGWNPIMSREFYLCTDGGHDQCCGKYGEEMLVLMRNRIQEKGFVLNLFRSSHLGGHKYAPTGIVFPQGDMYGRITQDDLDVFLDDIVRGDVYTEWYRGTLGTSKDAQIATYVTHERIHDVRVVSESETEKVIAVQTHQGAVQIVLEKKTFFTPDSCRKITQLKEKERWVVAELR